MKHFLTFYAITSGTLNTDTELVTCRRLLDWFCLTCDFLTCLLKISTSHLNCLLLCLLQEAVNTVGISRRKSEAAYHVNTCPV
jgi:hypothetical protein